MNHDALWVAERVRLFRAADPEFARWARGYGPIAHADLTQLRMHDLARLLVAGGKAPDVARVYRMLWAADRVTAAAMWLTVHMTYAERVYLDGRAMVAEDFKRSPEGHTGGSLNMVPAYIGYLLANALSGLTRGWLMGQGHCVAGIDACNLLVGNMTRRHADRYDLTEDGLTRFVGDFYSYAIDADGRPASPLGSHVGPHTAGGLSEGGYLGFAELQYVHMPLRGERLVVFLSDGAFEEQRGSDWAPRWWRAEDCGFVAPIMILNGRRIEQRSTMQQQGGAPWFQQHLRLNGFDPMLIDGTDPAAFAWAVHTMEERQAACVAAVSGGATAYPVPLHYTIAEAPKGFGFPGAGTNAAHNLPLGANPRSDDAARRQFNLGARALWVPPAEFAAARNLLCCHESQDRPRERDHPLARRRVDAPRLPATQWQAAGAQVSPMDAVDGFFADIVVANPQLRPRVGNPDELRSNRMGRTLDLLKHRVYAAEPGLAEAVDGAVITALNEEAVVSAALANKGGINLVVSYEAFAVKMLGALRQEILFARHQAEAGEPPRWLSVVTVVTSHTWENGKNEQSHQDPTLAEALLGEMSDTARVLFPVDANSAVATLRAAYATHGQFWTLVVPKRPVLNRLSSAEAERLVADGAILARSCAGAPSLLLIAIGAYQLEQALLAAERLDKAGVPTAVSCIVEPGRYRVARDEREREFVAGDDVLQRCFPQAAAARVIVGHMRPEPTLGLLRRLDTGPERTRALGYISRGGTLDVGGMLFANRCTWAHIVAEAAQVLGRDLSRILSTDELAAVSGRGDPRAVMTVD